MHTGTIRPESSLLPSSVPVHPHRNVAGLARAAIRPALRACVAGVVTSSLGLAMVNRVHRALPLTQKRRFFYLCHDGAYRVEGPWHVQFAGRRLVLALHRDFEPAWESAIGFHGYETEIHELYEALMRGRRPPRVFFDIGAHYGLHSLKLLAHGVQVVSFEPNIECHRFFRESARASGVRADIRTLALGRGAGTTTLVVPAHRSCLASTASDTIQRWGDETAVTRYRVPEMTLDEFIESERIVPDLLKIDTEGSELAVLDGASALLQNVRPLIVLESWRGSPDRVPLFRLLSRHGYGLHALAFGVPPSALATADGFVASAATNFLARAA